MKRSQKKWTLLLGGLVPPLVGLNILLFGGLPSTTQAGHAGAPGFWGLAAKTAVLLGLVLVLIYATFYLLRRFVYRGTFGNGQSQVEILQVAPLAAKKTLCVVKVVDRILVLGLAENSISKLSEIRSAEEQERWEAAFAPKAVRANSFAAQLEGFLKGTRN